MFSRYAKVLKAVPPPSFNFLFHSCFVPNLAVQAMQGESPGDRPRAMGIFQGVLRSKDGAGAHEQGQLYARAPLRLPSNDPFG